MKTSLLYVVAALIALLMGFVWKLWAYAWIPVLVAVIINLLIKERRLSKEEDSRTKM
ncbi:hypothetical protein ACWODI_06155 [Facklamia languida]|uniref:hypothetical protein n=1 Tax=Facklamia languida TaxID=82347 RepID=UPI000312406E|nr:hypothetical protein [Facklamia languida]